MERTQKRINSSDKATVTLCVYEKYENQVIKKTDKNEKDVNSQKGNNEQIDEEFTVSDMSADWMPWNRGFMRRPKRKSGDNDSKNKKKKAIDKKEYRKLVFAQYAAMLPVLLCITAAFMLIILLAFLWLK